MNDQPKYFFGYPSHPPLLAETIRTGARKINDTGMASSTTWEELRVAGRILIDEIASAIEQARVAALEVSALNENVLFELGMAIGLDKRVWPLLDRNDSVARRNFDRLRLLTSVGYFGYANSDDIRTEFLRSQPHESDDTIFQQLIEPSLVPGVTASVFYLPASHETDAANQVSTQLVRYGMRTRGLVQADPTETSVYPLSWYARQVYGASATIVHLAAERRIDADVHNGRSALVAGLAFGMGKPLLILAEEDYLAPVDYRDLVYNYASTKAATDRVNTWLGEAVGATEESVADRAARRQQVALKTELRSVRFGEPVAENEKSALDGYFVETAHFRSVVANRSAVFIGRKGSGKTANFLQAAQALHEDRRNLVAVIKPAASELVAATRALARYTTEDQRVFFVESLWQYLLYTEVAKATMESIMDRPQGPSPETPEWRLLQLVEDAELGIRSDFAVRLEKALATLEVHSSSEMGEEDRARATEALHSGQLRDLRVLLGECLASYDRVAILIDNLDKAWERGADLDAMATVLFGLLTAIGKLDVDFRRRDSWRDPIAVTLAVFLRTDIFNKIVRVAREPDKIPVEQLTWSDRDLLLRVIEDRWLADQPADTEAEELWRRFFVTAVDGIDTKNWILARILPRPRDIIYFCNAAVTNAVNAKHGRVEVDDLESAARYYSAFALEALLVENGLTIPEMEDVLFEFAGGASTLSPDEVREAIGRTGLNPSMVDQAITRLWEMSFLGWEIQPDEFAFAEDVDDGRKVHALVRRLEREQGVPARLRVHDAFRPYLELSD